MSTHLELKTKFHWKDLDPDHQIIDYFHEKLSKITNFSFINFAETIKVEVHFYQKTNTYKSTITVGIKNKPNIHAVSIIDHNLITTINDLMDKVHDQLRRLKTQLHHH